jgi:exodeoxyribonuclease VIII
MLKIIAFEKSIKPGIYNLSAEDYHQGPGISRSGLMAFKRSPYHYWYKYLNPDYITEPSTSAQILGSALHSYVLEPEFFSERYFVLPKFNKRTKSGIERWELMKHEIGSRDILSEDQWQILQTMAARIKVHPLVSQLIEKAEIEQSLYWTDPDTGILCKCRPDILRCNLVCDLKTAQDGSLRAFSRTIYDYGYHIQAAMIQEALMQLRQILIKDFLFLVIEKSAPYVISIYQLDQASLEQGRYEFKSLLTRYQQCLEANEWPPYEIQEISLPRYAFN